MKKIFLIVFLTLPACLPAVFAQERSDSLIVNFMRSRDIGFSCNNKVVLLESGSKKFEDMFEAIRNAQHTIHLEYFNFRNDSIARALFTLLAERAAQGVKVRALFDGFGNDSNNKPLRKKDLQLLRSKGIEIYEFDPLRFPWFNHALHRDHRKIVVIDGLVAYTGGMNVADYYIEGKPEFGDWRDLHMRIEGDAVSTLQGIFLNIWNKVTDQNIRGTDLHPGMKVASDFFPSLPKDTSRTAGHKMLAVVNREPVTSPRIIRETFVEAINSAQKQIQLINPYFTLNKKLRKALKKAIHRGVDVQIMVSEASDIPITPRVVDYNAKELMQEGATVYYYQGGFHHSKIMMIDGLYSFVGSANLNSRSLAYDYECNVLIVDPETTQELQGIFERDKGTRCYRLTKDLWKSKSGWSRFQSWIYHFLEPFI